jgi:hypothetical protein
MVNTKKLIFIAGCNAIVDIVAISLAAGTLKNCDRAL